MSWKHIGPAFRNKRGQIVALHPEGEYKARICVESCGGPVPSASCSRAYLLDKAESLLRKRAERYGWDEVKANA